MTLTGKCLSNKTKPFPCYCDNAKGTKEIAVSSPLTQSHVFFKLVAACWWLDWLARSRRAHFMLAWRQTRVTRTSSTMLRRTCISAHLPKCKERHFAICMYMCELCRSSKIKACLLIFVLHCYTHTFTSV